MRDAELKCYVPPHRKHCVLEVTHNGAPIAQLKLELTDLDWTMRQLFNARTELTDPPPAAPFNWKMGRQKP